MSKNTKKNNTKATTAIRFGFEEKKTKNGEPMFVEWLSIPKGVKLSEQSVADIKKAGFRWFGPLHIWSRYVNPKTGFAVKFLAEKFPTAEHPTHDEYAKFTKRVKSYYATPEGLARTAVKAEKTPKKLDEAKATLSKQGKSLRTQLANLSAEERKAILAGLN